MRKACLLLAGFLTQLFNHSLYAQADPAVAAKEQNSLLWKISGKDLQKPSYLFGTIHMICQQDYFFSEYMKKAFGETDQLIMEIDLSDPKTIQEYQSSMMLPAGKQLSQFFNDEKDFQDFSARLKNLVGIDASLFQQLKPLILLSLIAQKSFTCEHTDSYEMNLLGMAKERQMKVEGLETSLAQMKIFDDMKDQEVIDMLKQGIEDMEQDGKMQQDMINAYKNQDIVALHDIIVSAKEFQLHEAALIDDRNKNWAERLPLLMQQGACFVAVGAGHLSGKNGVINLLRQKGYTLTPVLR